MTRWIAEEVSTLPDRVLIEVEYDDGTVARWAMLPDDSRIKKLETVLGNPDTIKA